MLFYQHLSGKFIQHILFLFFICKYYSNSSCSYLEQQTAFYTHAKQLAKTLFFPVYTEIYGACKLCNYISLYMLSRTGSRGVQTASEPSCHTYRMGDSTTQFTFFVTSACKYTQIIYCLHLRLAPKVIPPPPRHMRP